METKTLNEHAEQIRQYHTTAVECERQSVEKGKQSIQAAIACGDNLTAAKTMLKHGEWLPWLAKNCPDVSEETCQRYMRLAKAAQVTDLTEAVSLRQAYIETGVIKEKKSSSGTRAGTSSGEGDKFSEVVNVSNRLVNLLLACDEASAEKMVEILTPILEWHKSQVQRMQKREAALNDGFEIKEAA